MEFARERYEAGFRAEAGELLRRMEEGLAPLGRGEGGAELAERVALAAHTLRGSATMMGYAAVAGIARLIEEALEGRGASDPARLGLAGECVAAVRACLSRSPRAEKTAGELRARAEGILERRPG